MKNVKFGEFAAQLFGKNAKNYVMDNMLTIDGEEVNDDTVAQMWDKTVGVSSTYVDFGDAPGVYEYTISYGGTMYTIDATKSI